MATLVTNRYLDDATCTAGEAFTLNGAVLTIRTDSRFHKFSPASMTGSIGSCAISSTLGGGVFIDGTKVRWLEISGGSGSLTTEEHNKLMSVATKGDVWAAAFVS